MIYLAISIIVIAYAALHLARNNERKKSHELDMKWQRSEQIHHFRSRLAYEFTEDIDNAMPSYEEMLHSDRPLIAKEWVNVDKLVNLN